MPGKSAGQKNINEERFRIKWQENMKQVNGEYFKRAGETMKHVAGGSIWKYGTPLLWRRLQGNVCNYL